MGFAVDVITEYLMIRSFFFYSHKSLLHEDKKYALKYKQTYR